MATVKVLLDTKRIRGDGTYPLKVRIYQNSTSASMSLNTFLTESQWNQEKAQVIKSHPNHKQINQLIKSYHLKAEQLILKLEYEEKEFTAKDVINTIKGKAAKSKKELPPDFFTYGYKLVNRMKQAGKVGNARVYNNTLKRLESYLGKKKLDFSKITYDWLEEFEACFLSEGIKVNTISFYLRTIRAIYNRAIKAKIVNRADYPFHDYSIKNETTRKRAIDKEKIKLIENRELQV